MTAQVHAPAPANGLVKPAGPPYPVETGVPHPLGATVDADGVNFSVFSEHATAIELLLFDEHDSVRAVPDDPARLRPDQRSFHFWHCYVRGLQAGTHYAFRVDGPWDPHERGHRFNPNKVLIDPYAKGITTTLWDRGAACGPDDNLATVDARRGHRPGRLRLGGRPAAQPPDVRDDRLRDARRRLHQVAHVRGRAPGHVRRRSSRRSRTCKSLGVTAVELLPVCEFDPREIEKPSPVDGTTLTNFWGYSTVGFFAPHSEYCTSPEMAEHIREFRDMVKALHKAGIEVILDVVFNHTSEGNHQGPTINFKGFDNDIYYHLVQDDRQYYMDYTGCGNTVNCNHPIADKLIVECLEFWVREMHVDGFRFDEGSILSRGEDGAPMAAPAGDLAHRAVGGRSPTPRSSPRPGTPPGCTRSATSRATAGPSGTASTATTCAASCKGDPGLVGAVASRIAGSRRHLPVQRPPADQQRQLHHLPRRLHPQRPGLLQRASTTRPTARATATATTTT